MSDMTRVEGILADVKRKANSLRSAACSNAVREALQVIDKGIEHSSTHFAIEKWPPVLLFLHRNEIDQLQAFETDLSFVASRVGEVGGNADFGFLQAGAENPSTWPGGLFELHVKSTLCRRLGIDGYRLDPKLANGKRPDAEVTLAGRRIILECTTLVDSDEDKETLAAFLEAHPRGTGVLIRPGEFDPEGAKGPSPYYEQIRGFAKVYDKLAPGLDPSRCQLSADLPNVLLLSLWPTTGNPDSQAQAIGWAIHELFADQPRRRPLTGDRSVQEIDTSLTGWLNFWARDLAGRGRLDLSEWMERFQDVIQLPRLLAGVLIFQDCRFARGFVNYNAHRENAISHAEMAELETVLAAAQWWSPR